MNTARSAAWTDSGECGELTSVEMANVRHLAEARVVLVAVAILVAVQEPAGPDRLAVLALLGVYAALALRELRRLHAGGEEDPLPLNHWVDLACYMPVAAMTGGLYSPYNVFLLFPVFTAWLRSGLPAGLLVAAVCGVTLTGIATMSGGFPAGGIVEDLAVAPLLLGLVVAVVIARWAHTGITIVRRLAFMNHVSRVFTPQHDLRRAIPQFCDMLRAYQHAETCVVLLKDARSAGWLLFELDGGEKPVRGETMEYGVVQPLLVVPNARAVTFRSRSLFTGGAVLKAYDAATLQAADDVDGAQVAELAQLLEAGSLVSLPLQSRSRTLGRLHLTSRGSSFRRNDVEFLAQVAAQVSLMIENMQLVERLTMEVADEERRKISRDLHDGTIQPYIGLKLALEALHRKVVADPVLVREVDDLIKMAGDGISQLRSYVGHLKSAGRPDCRDSLIPAIRRQAAKFSEYYGIATEVVADADIAVRGLLFEEVMHLVREGLSNIRRHTQARSAGIHIDAAAGKLRLRISNDTGAGGEPPPEPFFPRSMSERARELGGSVAVDRCSNGITIVSIELPV